MHPFIGAKCLVKVEGVFHKAIVSALDDSLGVFDVTFTEEGPEFQELLNIIPHYLFRPIVYYVGTGWYGDTYVLEWQENGDVLLNNGVTRNWIDIISHKTDVFLDEEDARCLAHPGKVSVDSLMTSVYDDFAPLNLSLTVFSPGDRIYDTIYKQVGIVYGVSDIAIQVAFPENITSHGGRLNYARAYEQKSITIAGDTTGTWLTDTGKGINVRFSLGVGSSYKTTAGAWAAGNYFAPTGSVDFISTLSATFYITGVQLEKDSTATSFDYRPYGTELAMCQRYYVRYGDGNSFPFASAQCYASTGAICMVSLPQPMRATPSFAYSNLALWNAGTSAVSVTGLVLNNITVNAVRLDATVGSGLVAGNASFLNSGSSSGNAQFNAEL